MMIPLRDEAAVDRGVPDVSALRRFAEATHMDHGVFLFAPRAGTEPLDVYSRMFAPDFGVFEDPATGSASGPLGCYLVRHGVAPAGTARIVSRQGVMMQRPSRIHIEIEGTRSEISRVKVGGQAVLVARGELLV
jgi:trans-2,3-dihydro-3-hydroxyanthranilate isomerase